MVNRKDAATMSITVDQVSVSKLGKAILTNVSLHILSGRVTALIGPNGAGKSTLLKVVSGDEKPSGGSISIDSTFLDNLSATELAKIRSVMTQSSQIVFDFLTEEVVALGLAFGRALNSEHNRLLIDEVVETCGIRPLLGRVFRTLSGGEQQRVLFARAVAQISEPMREKVNRYIFLDEPTSSLDVLHELSLLRHVQKIKGKGVGILIVMHDLNMAARFADEICVLQAGKVVSFGKARDVMTNDLLSHVYKTPISVEEHPKLKHLVVYTH